MLNRNHIIIQIVPGRQPVSSAHMQGLTLGQMARMVAQTQMMARDVEKAVVEGLAAHYDAETLAHFREVIARLRATPVHRCDGSFIRTSEPRKGGPQQ